MKSMRQLQDNIDAAKELLEQAQAEYEASMIELVRSGKVKEVADGEWKEVYTEDKVKVYCNHCNTYGIGGVRTPICPFCGAVMKNGNAVPKKRVVSNAASPDEKPTNKEKAETKTTRHHAATDKSVSPNALLASKAINYLLNSGCSDEEIRGKISASPASYSRWKNGKNSPRQAGMNHIAEGFRELTGRSIYEMGLFV